MSNPNNNDNPIFLFSAGWRSGSTMLQRLITSTGEALMWGESGGALDCFADALNRYEQMLGPGSVRYEHGFGGNGNKELKRFVAAGKDGVHEWTACMNPPRETIDNAFRKTLEAIYGEPARNLGYARWGIKEVRSGIKVALVLRNLYKNSKFVFLIRNPLSCLVSIKRRKWMDNPDIRDPLSFYALHWKKLAAEFRGADFGHLIRYEDLLLNRDVLDSLLGYLEISRSPANFISKSKVDWKPESAEGLTWKERLRMKMMLGEEMANHGYL